MRRQAPQTASMEIGGVIFGPEDQGEAAVHGAGDAFEAHAPLGGLHPPALLEAAMAGAKDSTVDTAAERLRFHNADTPGAAAVAATIPRDFPGHLRPPFHRYSSLLNIHPH